MEDPRENYSCGDPLPSELVEAFWNGDDSLRPLVLDRAEHLVQYVLKWPLEDLELDTASGTFSVSWVWACGRGCCSEVRSHSAPLEWLWLTDERVAEIQKEAAVREEAERLKEHWQSELSAARVELQRAEANLLDAAPRVERARVALAEAEARVWPGAGEVPLDPLKG